MGATIYFSGAISGGRADVATYRRIIDALAAEGHDVLAGAVAAEAVGDGGETIAPSAIFTRDMKWIEQADVLVAEVSAPSTGVGYEVAAARYRFGIPVVCLWRPAFTKRCSAMITGDAGIVTIEYEEVGAMLPRLLESIRKVRR